jgi:diguanylate cyclase (GGDEF)-like protein
MAASDHSSRSEPLSTGGTEPLSGAELEQRLDEEISRAERHGTKLSCLLVVIDDLEQIAGEQGSDLPEQTLEYLASALRRQLRRFDRVGRAGTTELLIVLPGADGPLGEIVARRVLERVRAIKVEAGGTRRPVRVSLGLAAWQGDMSAADLLGRARAAAARPQNGNGEDPPPAAGVHRAFGLGGSDTQAQRPFAGPSSAFEGATPS